MTNQTDPKLIEERIRQSARRSGPSEQAQRQGRSVEASPALQSLRQSIGIASVNLAGRRHRRLTFFLVRVRRFLMRLLGPVIERQTLYNAANVAVIEQLSVSVDDLKRDVATLSGVQCELPAQGLDLNYSSLMERFRGGEGEIADRQRGYIDLFAEAKEVLDLGCGRGEFLELLHDAGVSCRGVDMDERMVAHCREKGLDAIVGDAAVYLDGIPDRSVGGVFAAQIAEHMSTLELLKLVRLAWKKLSWGGVLVLETPNPGTLVVLSTFTLDFTHVRLYHPEALRWLLEEMGFEGVHLRFSSPADESLHLPPLPLENGSPELEEFNRRLESLNSLLFGFQDYAVIGRVPAGT